jgi:hypothetical protein
VLSWLSRSENSALSSLFTEQVPTLREPGSAAGINKNTRNYIILQASLCQGRGKPTYSNTEGKEVATEEKAEETFFTPQKQRSKKTSA